VDKYYIGVKKVWKYPPYLQIEVMERMEPELEISDTEKISARDWAEMHKMFLEPVF